MQKLSFIFIALLFLGFSNAIYSSDTISNNYLEQNNVNKKSLKNNSNTTTDMSNKISNAINIESAIALAIDDDNDFSYEETDYGYD